MEDIVEYSANVIMLIKGYTFESLVSDKRTYYSVMKNVEVVGEAAYMLTKAFKKAHPATPWKVVQGMRHVLVHDYATIDDRELFNTAVNDIPVLQKQVKRYLAEIDWGEWEQGEDPFTEIDNAVYKQAVSSARKMKAKGYAVQDIAEITGLTTEEIEAL